MVVRCGVFLHAYRSSGALGLGVTGLRLGTLSPYAPAITAAAQVMTFASGRPVLRVLAA